MMSYKLICATPITCSFVFRDLCGISFVLPDIVDCGLCGTDAATSVYLILHVTICCSILSVGTVSFLARDEL